MRIPLQLVTSSKQPHIPVDHFPSGGVDLVLDILGFILEIGKKKKKNQQGRGCEIQRTIGGFI